MLKLSDKTKIAEGTARIVHYVIGEKDLLVKVELPKKLKKKRIFKSIYNYLFPAHNRFSLREINEDMRIQVKAQLLGIPSPIAPTRGLIQTSMGLGLLVNRIGPKSGGLGPTLETLKQENKINAVKLKALNSFTTAMYRTGVITNDLQPVNVIWNETTKSFLLIDGFGERNFIKLKTYIPYLRNRRIFSPITLKLSHLI